MRVFFAILALASLSWANSVEIGAPAPALKLTRLWQAPLDTKLSWEDLKGQVVVLEFWATWCSGCRDQISHLNRLQEQFRNKPVRFLSITDEETGVVGRFLKEYPISGWIGFDLDGHTFNAYGVMGRPTTAVIDAHGVLRGIGNASDLTGALLENLLDGKAIAYSMDPAPAVKLQALPNPFYSTMLRPAGPVNVTGFSPGAISGKTGKSWNAWGVSLPRLLSSAYGVPEDRIVLPEPTSAPLYDVALAAPNLTEAERIALLRRTLEEAFHLRTHPESRETDVYVLQSRPGLKPKLRRAGSNPSSHWGGNGQITAVAMPLSAVLISAERTLGKATVDDTELKGNYDFELKWDPSKPASFVEAVRTQLGLELIPSRRQLDYLIADSIVQPQSW